MRALILVLMMALLPLRGWMGDVMAMEMAVQSLDRQAVATKLVAKHAMNTRAAASFSSELTVTAHADCMDHALSALPAISGATTGDAIAGDTGHCSTCLSCQVCHSVALTVFPQALTLTTPPHSVPRIQDGTYTSAEPARGFKPPIA